MNYVIVLPLLKRGFIRRGMEYWCENKSKQLFTECLKFYYTRSAKQVAVACKKKKRKKLTASSMQHEAKIAYYAFDVIRFFVPYAARLKLRGRVAR